MTNRELKELLSALAYEQSQVEALADLEEDRVFKAFRRAQARTYRRIAAIVQESPDWKTLSASKRLEWWVQNRAAINKALLENGYTEAVTGYVDALPKFAELSGNMLRAQGIEFAQYPKELIDHYRNATLERFAELGATANSAVLATMFDNVITGQVKGNALENLKGVITGEYSWGNRKGLYEWHAGTYVRTAHVETVRELAATQADELGLERFIYIGPFDAKTRRFCSGLVGQVKTRAEIDALDNGQRPNVLTTGGGWNCRHHWNPVTQAVADAMEEHDGTEIVKQEIKATAQPPIETGKLMDNTQWIQSLTKTEADGFGNWKWNSSYIRDYQLARHRGAEALDAWGRRALFKSQPKFKEDILKWEPAITQALDRAQPYSGTVYRGLKLTREQLSEFSKLKTLELNTLSSSSKSEGVARYFGNLVLRIKNKTGVDIERVSTHRAEQEVILRANVKYRVTGASRKQGVTYLDLEEITDAGT